MRIVFITALFLAACSPPASQAPEPAPAETATTAQAAPAIPDPNALTDNPASTWTDVERDPQLIGRWVYFQATSNAFINASYGANASEPAFSFVCDRARRVISMTRDIELTPDQATGLAIITPTTRHLFAAQSFNEGPPRVSAEIPAADPRLDDIAASEGLSLQAAGDTSTIHGDPMLARVLAECRA